MTRRELVFEALNHRETRPIPYHIEYTTQALDRLIAYTGDPGIADTFSPCMHYNWIGSWPEEIPGKQEYFKDIFGVVWNRSGADKDIGVVDDPVIKDIEDNDYRFPEFDSGRARREIEQMLAGRGDRFTIMGLGFTMFERAWSLMGMENTLVAMIAYPDELEKLLDGICDFQMRLVDIAMEYDDIDGIIFGDDWGQQHGLIMGPDHWRRFIKGRMAKLYERVKSHGKFVIQHSCGDNNEILGDLLDIGLDCYQTFQPEIYDIAAVKKRFGSRLSIWGGVSTQRALSRLTPDQLKQEIVRVVTVLKPGGGLIIAPTHALPQDVPPENILAMAEVFKNQDIFFR